MPQGAWYVSIRGRSTSRLSIGVAIGFAVPKDGTVVQLETKAFLL
jgi:hypothetical protein